MVDAAKLDRRITIEQQTSSQDAFGQDTGAWSTFATVWAGKNITSRARNNTEGYQSMQNVAERKDFFEIRFLSGLHERMRIITEEGEIYNIVAIEEINRREAQRIFAVNKDRADDGI